MRLLNISKPVSATSAEKPVIVSLRYGNRNMRQVVMAAVALGAPVVEVEKTVGAVKLLLGVSAHVWEKTGGEEAYLYRLKKMLNKLDRLETKFPGISDNAETLKLSNNRLRIKQDPLTKRLFLQARLVDGAAAERVNTMLGGHCRNVKSTEGIALLESEPSSVHYGNDYSPVRLGTEWIKKNRALRCSECPD